VLYVYGMQCNLLSFGKHMQNCYTVIMKDNSLELFDRNQILMWKSPFAKKRTIQASMKTTKMRCLFATTGKDES